MRAATGSQWRSWRRGITWENLGRLKTRRAAVFWYVIQMMGGTKWCLYQLRNWNKYCRVFVHYHEFNDVKPEATEVLCDILMGLVKDCYHVMEEDCTAGTIRIQWLDDSSSPNTVIPTPIGTVDHKKSINGLKISKIERHPIRNILRTYLKEKLISELVSIWVGNKKNLWFSWIGPLNLYWPRVRRWASMLLVSTHAVYEVSGCSVRLHGI